MNVWPIVISAARVLFLIAFSPYELVGDEAQYWDWSRHLDWSYYTKGPGVAWTIALSTWILGDAEWAIRMPAVLSGALSMLVLARLAMDMCAGMAKAGLNHPDFDILSLMAERLTSGDQEIRETAALAMGISQMPAAVDRYLIHLVEDREIGRRLVDRGEVDYRTRSFAAYGLGLVSWATEDVDLKTRAFEALKGILEDDSIVSRDVRVAAINGLGLIAPDPKSTDPKEQKLLTDCLDALESYYMKPPSRTRTGPTGKRPWPSTRWKARPRAPEPSASPASAPATPTCQGR